jgi:hypothetical protein
MVGVDALGQVADVVLQPCEFRQERTLVGGEPRPREIVCMAAGSARLAWTDGDMSFMERACSTCPIPEVIAHDEWACLFLRPVRFIEEDEAYLCCRYFFKLSGEHQPKTMIYCHRCPHWYPRPPLRIIVGYEEETERIRRWITGEDREEHERHWNPAAPPTRGVWRRMLDLLGWV